MPAMCRRHSRESSRGFYLAVASAGLAGALTPHFASAAGPYAPAAGQTGTTAVANTNPSIVAWATSFTDLNRGLQDINVPTGPRTTFGSGSEAVGPAEGTFNNVVSLGDSGSITLQFSSGIRNGPGADFAVFENSINDSFLELAYVEVSSNGTDFVRFAAISLTQTTTQVGGFASLDPTNLDSLAGKYRGGFGTPFDLQSLQGRSGLDVDHVQYVRVIDVVGRIAAAPDNPGWSPSTDSLGNIINDPYSTPFETGGFDLDGIGVINAVPEPGTMALVGFAGLWLRRRRRR